jgi:transposase
MMYAEAYLQSITNKAIVPLSTFSGSVATMPNFNNRNLGHGFLVARGVFSLRYFLGCDVCKSKVDVALVSEQGAVLWTDKVPNQTVDIAEYLLTLSGHYIDDEIICIAEDTSIYHHPLLEACHAVNTPCRTYNPILTRQGIKGSIRGKKTDKSDAILIARMGIRGEGRINTPEPYKTTRYAARAQRRLGNLSGSVRLYQRHIEDVLKGDLSNEVKELLETIQTQFALARRQFVIDTAKSAPPDLMRKLQTIPGIGPYIAASVIGEIQDMSRFRTSKQLIAYAGLDPKIRQSGHSLNKTGRLTKRGSAYLATKFVHCGVHCQAVRPVL